MLLPVSETRRLKHIDGKGQKSYSAVILFLRGSRILRRKGIRTASEAIAYGREVGERYRRWCEVAKEMEK